MYTLNDKLIVNVALTGMVPLKTDNPNLPVTPAEIAADVCRCYDAGASIFHIHARDEFGRPTYRLAYFREILAAVRLACSDPELIVCVTTSGRVHNTLAKRSEVLDLSGPLKPDMASLTLGSMNFPQQASVNEPEMVKALALKMQARGIVPELEVFELGMIEYAYYLVRKGLLHPPFYFNLLLGSLGTLGATPLNLALMVNALPAGAVWGVGGSGRFQFQANAMSITMGGHVRVGLEDALYMDTGKTDPASNPRLVERLVRLARAAGREPATSAEARQMIGLPARTPVQTPQAAMAYAG